MPLSPSPTLPLSLPHSHICRTDSLTSLFLSPPPSVSWVSQVGASVVWYHISPDCTSSTSLHSRASPALVRVHFASPSLVSEACIGSASLPCWRVRGGHCSNQLVSSSSTDSGSFHHPKTLRRTCFMTGKASRTISLHLTASHCISLHLGG